MRRGGGAIITAAAAALLALGVAPRSARAQAGEVTIAPIRVAAPRDDEAAEAPHAASVLLDRLDGEPSRLLVWGPGLSPSTCLTPCELSGDAGQYGVTVTSGASAWSVGFVLEGYQRRARVRLRPPSAGRMIGGALMIGFGGAASTVGLGFAITALITFNSSAGVVLGLAIALPLLATGVPLLAGGIALAIAASPAARVESASPPPPQYGAAAAPAMLDVLRF